MAKNKSYKTTGRKHISIYALTDGEKMIWAARFSAHVDKALIEDFPPRWSADERMEWAYIRAVELASDDIVLLRKYRHRISGDHAGEAVGIFLEQLIRRVEPEVPYVIDNEEARNLK
jgi:hypothetical protein